ncbi:MAG TPA: SH3 domain-containing protein, partial [Aggregatilineales bacterium]|nr:SH3 domain-containing protein [Aggregatilineales bacterium]
GANYREMGIGIQPCQTGAGARQQYAVFMLLGSQPNVLPVVINSGEAEITAPELPLTVQLSIHDEKTHLPQADEDYFGTAESMRIANHPPDDSVESRAYEPMITWELDFCGENTVYVELTDTAGHTIETTASVNLVGCLKPTDTPAVVQIEVLTQRSIVRSGPGNQYEQIAVVERGAEFLVVAVTDEGDWYQVVIESEMGWIAAETVSLTGDETQIEIVQIPTSTPVPTDTLTLTATASSTPPATATIAPTDTQSPTETSTLAALPATTFEVSGGNITATAENISLDDSSTSTPLPSTPFPTTDGSAGIEPDEDINTIETDEPITGGSLFPTSDSSAGIEPELDIDTTETALAFNAQATSDSATATAAPTLASAVESAEVTEFEIIDTAGGVIGEGEVHVFSPTSMKIGEVSEIRVEIRVNSLIPELSAALNPEPSATPVIGTPRPTQTALPLVEAQFIEIREYMGAELGGIDVDHFDIDTVPPSGIRLMQPEAVNWWKWTIKPNGEEALGTNKLEIVMYIPQEREDGVDLRRETNIIPFEIEVTPVTVVRTGDDETGLPIVPLIIAVVAVAGVLSGGYVYWNRRNQLKIFISYRRQDSLGTTGRIYD